MTIGTPARRSNRREQILGIAVRLFAERGYHGVSMDDIGSAAGVTGPALYHHFAGKESMLVAALTPVSEGLLAGGRERVAASGGDPRAALESLVEFHVGFALANPAVIALHLHELDRLPDEPRRQVRRLQRLYVEEWVRVLGAVRPDLSTGDARVLAHAAFGLMNSTPFIGGDGDRPRRAALLRGAALAALLGTPVESPPPVPAPGPPPVPAPGPPPGPAPGPAPGEAPAARPEPVRAEPERATP